MRPEGKGWVYYTSSGHDERCWNDANFQKQVLQALNWGASIHPTLLAPGREAVPGRAASLGYLAGYPGVRITDASGKLIPAGSESGAGIPPVLSSGAYRILGAGREGKSLPLLRAK